MLGRVVFDAWHADVEQSAACRSLCQQVLGLPPEAVSNSLLPWAGMPEIAAALRLAPGQVLVDLACGRGGYSREAARRTGARLVGLDFSAVAVAAAARGGPGQFCVSDFTAVGLRDGCADAVMCVDAVQFSDPTLAALAECRRILVPGGRLAVTAWEPRIPGDERVTGQTGKMNLSRDLAAAGFEQVEVTEKPDWYAAERALWEAALQADADGDPGLASLQSDGTHSLPTFDLKRRVLATATAPPA